MNPVDPIILTAYLICLAYFIYRIIDSFNDEFTIRLDEEPLKQHLSEHKLEDAIGISFKFDSRYEFDKLKQLAISISNKSDSSSIYVDWDYSSFTDLDGRSRRVTRLMPGTTLDLFQSQVFSTVTPKTTLKENITAEDQLQRRGEQDKSDTDSPLNLVIEPTKTLIDLSKPGPKAPDSAKRRYERFMKRKTELGFSLELALRLVGPNKPLSGDRIHIPCKLILKKLPWTAGLPWNPKS